MKLAIEPTGPVRFDLAVPGSKSLTNRALIAAALSPGTSRLTNASLSDDSRFLSGALGQVGIKVDSPEPGTLVVRGGTLLPPERPVYLGNAGTAFRFFTALACLGRGTTVIDGDERMRERPIGGLVEALRMLGAEIRYGEKEGFPPLVVEARGLQAGRAVVQGDTSSQFVSSLLLSSPGARGAVEIEVLGEPTSKPYLEITLDVLRAFGIPVEREGYRRFRIRSRYAKETSYSVEGDGASAGYFLAMAAATGGRAKVRGIGSGSHQGEIGFTRVLEKMGCRVSWAPDWVEVTGGPLRGVDVDMNDCPDCVQTLACVALFAHGPTRVRNVKNLRVKETDRIAAVEKECSKLGAAIQVHDDGFTLAPPASVGAAEIDTYKDHRMAMSFAVAAVRSPGIVLRDPECVSKSYPEFFDQLEALGVRLRRIPTER